MVGFVVSQRPSLGAGGPGGSRSPEPGARHKREVSLCGFLLPLHFLPGSSSPRLCIAGQLPQPGEGESFACPRTSVESPWPRPSLRAGLRGRVRTCVQACVRLSRAACGLACGSARAACGPACGFAWPGSCDPHPPPLPSDQLSRGWWNLGGGTKPHEDSQGDLKFSQRTSSGTGSGNPSTAGSPNYKMKGCLSWFRWQVIRARRDGELAGHLLIAAGHCE
jgi:hypothetical protein